jgi:hypothetical protein
MTINFLKEGKKKIMTLLNEKMINIIIIHVFLFLFFWALPRMLGP